VTALSPTHRPGAAGAVVHARGLSKRFGALTAVDAVDFDVAPGEAFGFLGPNGAGKTSTMRMIGCVSPVTEGTLRVLGMDPATAGPRIRARLGVVPQENTLDNELTVLENLLIHGRYFDLPRGLTRQRAAELLDFVQLTERARDEVEPLSGGMKRRLTIARALINEPDLLLLDEPTTGLDPQARHLLWDRLYRLKQRGVTLVLTTHYMDEAEQLCDRLVVMDRARIVAEGSPRELIDRYVTREVLELRFPPETQAALYAEAVSESEGPGSDTAPLVPHEVEPVSAVAGPYALEAGTAGSGRAMAQAPGDRPESRRAAGDGTTAGEAASGVPDGWSSAELRGVLEGTSDRVEILPDRTLLYAADGEAAAAAVHARGLRPESVLVRRSTLEDVFLRLTGRRLID
jgi:lipooligosaccharide transport system ATP-binding protein